MVLGFGVGVLVGVSVGTWRLRKMMNAVFGCTGIFLMLISVPIGWFWLLTSVTGADDLNGSPYGGMPWITDDTCTGWLVCNTPIEVSNSANTSKKLSAGKSAPGCCWRICP